VSERLRVEVDDQHGTAAIFTDPALLGQLSPRKRAQAEELAAGLVRKVAAVTGRGEDDARLVVLADLTRLAADEAAYDRVCQQRGILPL